MALVTSTRPAPTATRKPQVREHHGDRFTDPYAWLSDADDPAVIRHLEAENAYADERLARSRPLADRVFDEMRSHVRETDITVPVRMGGWWYYSRTSEGKQYPVHCRVADAGASRPVPEPDAALPGEQVLIDVNAQARGQRFYQLGGVAISRDGLRMAVLSDTRGDERYALQVRDLRDGTVVDEAVSQAGYGLVWSWSGEYVFYTRSDDAWRQHQVWRHRVGSSQDEDVLVLQEDDPSFNLGIEESSDERWLVVQAASSTTGEGWLLPLDDPTAALRSVHPREHGLDYSVDVDGDRILLVHNGSQVDFELASAPLDSTGRESWTTVLAARESERVLGVEAFESFVAVAMRSGGVPTVRILRKDGTAGFEPSRETGLDGDATSVAIGDNPEYSTDTVQLTLESYLTPRTVYDLHVAAGELTMLKQRVVPGFDADRYVESRVWVPADGGARVPLSIVRLRSLTADGTNAGHLAGYGSYEVSLDPSFSVRRLTMLDRGVVCAVAHVRGGGELGRRWYDDGKLLAKRHTFTDFVACAQHLVDCGWVAPDRLAGEGASAGGLLIGAAVNLRPDLFRAVHAAVPFVDALTTILDPSMPLTVGEWEEWGNPLESAEVYAYMKSYTPYENVRPVPYPAVLATTSLNDTRVMFTEPAKWVQVLRSTVTSDQRERPILLRTEMVAGHGGRSGRYDAWRQQATETAFLLDQIGACDLR